MRSPRALCRRFGVAIAGTVGFLISGGTAVSAQEGWTTTVARREAAAPIRPQPVGSPAETGALPSGQDWRPIPIPQDVQPLAPAAPVVEVAPPAADPQTQPAKAPETSTAKPETAAAPSDPTAPIAAADGRDAVKPRAVESYCANILTPATDARFLRQKQQLNAVRKDIDQRVARLDDKIGEYKVWLARRDEFSRKAQDNLVGIFAGMKSESAAQQLTEIDEETAAAVLIKLDTRQASSIMNEIEAKKAARLMQIVAGASEVEQDQQASSATGLNATEKGGEATTAVANQTAAGVLASPAATEARTP